MRNPMLRGLVLLSLVAPFPALAAEFTCQAYNSTSTAGFGLKDNEAIGELAIQVPGIDAGALTEGRLERGRAWKATQISGTGKMQLVSTALARVLAGEAQIQLDANGDLRFADSYEYGVGLKLARRPVSAKQKSYAPYSRGWFAFEEGGDVLRGFVTDCAVK